MINYTVEDPQAGMFGISYSDLREHYQAFVRMKDQEFLLNLPKAAHFACIVCWFKEVGPNESVGDKGIVHELIHLMCEGTTTELKTIRKSFREILKLD